MFEELLLFADPGVIRFLLLVKHAAEYFTEMLPASPTLFSFPQNFSFSNSVFQSLFFRSHNTFRLGGQYLPESLNDNFNNESPGPLLNNR